MDINDFFTKNYQKILQSDIAKSDKASTLRKSLAQSFNFALAQKDSTGACYLLEKGFKAYDNTLDEKGIIGKKLQGKVEALLLNHKNRKALVSSLDDNKTLTSCFESKPQLCCKVGDEKIQCEKSENAYKMEFDEFISNCEKRHTNKQAFQRNETINSINENMHKEQALGGSNVQRVTSFKTAREYKPDKNAPTSNNNTLMTKGKTLGIRRRFVSPVISQSSNGEQEQTKQANPTASKSDDWTTAASPDKEIVDERLKNIDPKMVELIKSEIMDINYDIQWVDIAGLEFAKTAIQEAVVWPMLRPDIFKGLRRPPKGVLLFGPPGTGKTLIGKCVASQSKSTFFSISASSLTSKWVGEGEKMVRALFTVARVHQPAVIFIDEIDSLLSQRNESEHESSRRIKTEFLVQLDGATTDSEERLLVIGATNRPQELDEAARRRFVRRLYIPLPEYEARLQLITRLISTEKHDMADEDLGKIATLSDGYSGADIRNLCSEASLGPIRSLDMAAIEKIQVDEVRPLNMVDFERAFSRVRSSVSPSDLDQYVTWDKIYGAGL